ncbi:hypothetical protein OIU92_00220 [Escherichia coli]|nr:hypothetical protein [Escherichia coli]
MAAPRVIREGQPCTVRLGADTVLTGYIDDFIPSYDAENVEIRVMGRDKTGDLVDCSVVHSSGKWKGVRLEQVAADSLPPVRDNRHHGNPDRGGVCVCRSGNRVKRALNCSTGWQNSAAFC